jgi:hypothetical protein
VHLTQAAFQALASEIQRLVESPQRTESSQRHNTESGWSSSRSQPTTRGSVDNDNLAGLIQSAVSTGISMARRQWELEFLQNKANSANAAQNETVSRLESTIEALTEKLDATEAKYAADAQTKIAHLEQRIVRLEGALLASTFKDQANVQVHSQQSVGSRADPEAETELRNRLAMLELAVEQEHESSLQVLDALLLQQRQFKQLQATTSASAAQAIKDGVEAPAGNSKSRRESIGAGAGAGTGLGGPGPLAPAATNQRRKSSILAGENGVERDPNGRRSSKIVIGSK